jgi:ribosomal protein L37AE/L43A
MADSYVVAYICQQCPRKRHVLTNTQRPSTVVFLCRGCGEPMTFVSSTPNDPDTDGSDG